METNLTQNWLGLAALLVGVGALIYAVWQGKASTKNEDADRYTEKLEHIVERGHQMQREEIEALRAMTDEMRLTRDEVRAVRDEIKVTRGEQLGMHAQNADDIREVRDALRHVERTQRQ